MNNQTFSFVQFEAHLKREAAAAIICAPGVQSTVAPSVMKSGLMWLLRTGP